MKSLSLRTLALVLALGGVVSLTSAQAAPAAAPVAAPAKKSVPAAQPAGKGSAAVAKPAPVVPQKGASVEGITEYRLSNGLRVLLFLDPSKPTVTVNVTYLVGSRHEGYGETGMAHLLEHLLFKGTPKHPNINQELTAHGARPNGSTWYDRTNYFETFSATDENLEWALDLEADRMVNSFIAKADLDSEMTVVRNEFERNENSPQAVLIERVLSTMYLWHNYGKSTIGARADLENVPIERLQAFYRKYYQPDNAVLIVAGKFDEAKTLALIGEKFGAIPRPQRVLETTYTVEPAQDGERTVNLQRVGDSQVLIAGYHIPAASHPDFAAVEALQYVLADTPSGRLHRALVETQKAVEVYGWAKDNRDPSFLLLGAVVRSEKPLADVRQGLLATVEEVMTKSPPTDKEMQRARDALLKGWETTLRNSERAAIEISEWVGTGDWRLMFVHRDRLEQVAASDVTRVAKAYLAPENRTVGTYTPTAEPRRAEIPASPNVAALTKFYKGREAMAQGEVFDASVANIESRLERSTLASGAQVILLPKKTRGATVNVSMQFNLGGEATLRNRGTAGDLVPEMLLRGTAKRTREQIQDELDRMKTQLRISGAPFQVQVSLETTREQLEPSLRLLGELLRESTFPDAEVELLRQERLVQMEEGKTDPQQKAFTAFQRHINPYPANDPRYAETPDEAIAAAKAVKAEEIRAFHRDFYGASAAQIAVVGDFDKAPVAALLGELLGGWQSNTKFERLVAKFEERPALVQKIEAPDKENAVFVAGQRLPLIDTDADYPAAILGNFMTGGGSLNSRLAVRLRQKEGFSYSVGSTFQASSFDRDGVFMGYAIYAPQNGDNLQAAFLEEIQKVLDAGFTEEEIAEAKKGLLQQRQLSRGMDRELTRTLVARQYQGRTLAWDTEYEARIEKLTSAETQAALKKLLDPKKLTLIQAGDFAKAAAK